MKMTKILAVVMAVLMVALCFTACGGNEAKIVVAEKGSAGEEVMNADAYFADYEKIAVDSQAKTLVEVKSGTADAAVIDALMAGAMIGEGTSYADLTYTVSLNSEEYGVGFRKGSDLAEALNDYFKASYEDGSMMECANTYGVQAAIIEQ